MKILKPDDFHVHLRTGEMLKSVIPYTASVFGRALIMPNTVPPILTAEDVTNYLQEINENKGESKDFVPLMTGQLTPDTDPKIMPGLKSIGVIAMKLYPNSVTTNSENGVTDFQDLYPVFQAMSDNSLALCPHGEMPGAESLLREWHFIPILKDIY